MLCYLSDRANFVFYNGFDSNSFISTGGLPQRSNLDPLVFNIFINDLLQSLTCCALAYADDLKLFCTVSNHEEATVLQHNIDLLVKWSTRNNLVLNTEKCYARNVTRKANRCHCTYIHDSKRTSHRC